MTDARNLAAAAQRATRRMRMRAAAALVETLAAHGVKKVFGILGSPRLDPLDLLPSAGIRLVGVVQPQSAAQMADGYGRVIGRPAVCIAPDGPVFSQLLPAVTAAYRARSPLVLLTQESAGLAAGQQGGFLETGHAPLFAKVTRWQARVSLPAQVADLMHQALAIAARERGPVLVSFSDECLGGESDYEIREPQVIERTAGGARSLTRASQLLANAKFPVIVAGDGLTPAGGVEELRALAEQLTAPVVCAFQHNDMFPAGHPLAGGPLGPHGSAAAMRLLARADVVLVLGARPGQDAGICRENAKFIQIDSGERTPGAAGEVAVAIQGDAGLALRELLGHFKGRATRKTDRARLAEVQREKESWLAELAALPSPHRKGHIGARRALAQLARALPRNAMVSTDVGAVCAIASSYLGFEQPGSFLAAMDGASPGCAYPAALGAKLARPDRPAIAYVGEGAWAIGLAEVTTALKERIPAIAVVFNNGQGDAATPDFSEAAWSMGAEGCRVEYEDEVADALKAALRSGKPSVVEIMVTPERGDIFGR
jgi:sulfoacetaldehyde acetyltransferase